MKFKKLASLALAGAMSLSLAVPAFASGNDLGNTETEITGTYTEPVINVVVPQTGTAIINPLGLEYKIGSTSIVGQQIVTAAMLLKNQSGMDLQVGASVTATVGTGSTLRFVSTSTGGTGATKTIYAYLQAKQEATLTGADSAVTDALVGTAYGAWTDTTYRAASDVLVNTALATSTDNLVVLRAADMSGANGAFAGYNAGSIALVRLTGDCVTSPTTAAWAATETDTSGKVTGGDSFTVNVAYTFKPASIAKYGIDTSDITDATGVTTTVVPDVTTAAEGDTVTLTVTSTAGAVVTLSASATVGSSSQVVTLSGDDVTTNSSNSDAVDFAPTAGSLSTTVTFVMPAGDVAVTAVSQ